MTVIVNNVRIAGLLRTLPTPGDAPTITPTTWNPADKQSNVILSNGNLTATGASSDGRGGRSIASVTSGKYYWEVTIDSNYSFYVIGVSTNSASLNYPGFDTSGIGYYGNNGNILNSSQFSIGASGYTTIGSIISVALNMDNGKMWFRLNGVWQGTGSPDPATDTDSIQDINGSIPLVTTLGGGSPIFASFGTGSSSGSGSMHTTNFGATAFTYSVPTGFSAGFGS